MVQRVSVTDHVLLTVARVPIQPSTDVSGTYRLTITADSACSDQLPEELRTRRYGARVTQLGPEVTVRLEGAALVTSNEWGGHFVGRMDGAGPNVAFTLAVDFYYASYYLNGAFLYPPDVFERLGGSRYFGVSGRAVTRVSASALSGTLNGSFWITDMSRPWPTRIVAECRSAQHSLVLSR